MTKPGPDELRPYPHRPDAAHLLGQADFLRSGLDRVSARINRVGPEVWATMGRTAVSTGWDAIRISWAQQRPLPEIRTDLDLVAHWVRQQAGAVREPVDLLDVAGWLWTLVIAGDAEAARDLAARIPAGVTSDIAANAPLLDRLTAVARFVDGGVPIPAIEALRSRLADPRLDPVLVGSLQPELTLLEAISRHDQQLLVDGFTSLRAAQIERYRGSRSGRRDVSALLDMTGLMYAALAVRRGLFVPVDDPYLPTALLATS